MNTISLLAALGLMAAAPATAANGWLPTKGGDRCEIAALALELNPHAVVGERTYFGSGIQILAAKEGDVGIRVSFSEKAMPNIVTFPTILMPNDGFYADGTAALRVSIDGKVAAERERDPVMFRGAERLVRWWPDDLPAYSASLRHATAMQIDFLDGKGNTLRSRTIDLTRVGQAAEALIASRWTC